MRRCRGHCDHRGRGHCSHVVTVVAVIGRCRPLSSVIVVTAIVTLPVVSAAPSMAEDTASIEPAGGAEKAPSARPEAWHMVGQGRVGRFEVARR